MDKLEYLYCHKDLDLIHESSINPFLGMNKEGRIWFFGAFLEFLAN
jgi:hypothetical protein